MRTQLLILCLFLTTAASAAPALGNEGAKRDLEIGLFAGYGFPDGYDEGATPLSPDDGPLYGVRLGYFFTPRWSVELSGQQFASETNLAPASGAPDVDFDINSLRLNGLYNFRPERSFRPFVTFGVGLEKTVTRPLLDEDDAGLNLGGGLRWFLTQRFGLRLDARYVVTDVGGALDARQSNVETTVGVLWAFGGAPPADSDSDGVADSRDACPDTPIGAVVDDRGCPSDTDADGVVDGLDECPDTPTGVPVDRVGCPRDSDGDGVQDGEDDCPDTSPGTRVDRRGCPLDADADGVPDGLDRCPDTPRRALVDPRGCPVDGDRDGVFDGLDRCPATPAGARVAPDGCPTDEDADGVWDGLDRCPGTPHGTQVDSRGCKMLFEARRGTLVLEGVRFEFDSARLTEEARRILDRVALSLAEWSEIRVEIAGHTDSLGDASYNLRLSTRRAAAVQAYLQSRGTDARRMVARGYGEERPIADERTLEGRKKNRRVELKRLD